MDKIKILIVTQADPFYLPFFFRQFFERLKEHESKIELDGLIIQPPLGARTLLGLAKRVVGLYGAWGTLVKILEWLQLKLKDLVFIVGIGVEPNSIRLLVKKHGYSLLQFISVNDKQCIAYVKQRGIDLIVSVSAAEIFRQEILAAPRKGCINLHNGDLPRYKGMMPNFWQMYHGEEHSVLTIHTMSPHLDGGDIVLKMSRPMQKGVPLERVIRDTKISSADILIKWLARVERGKPFETTKMNGTNARYFGFPSRDDVKEFRKRGHRVI